MKKGVEQTTIERNVANMLTQMRAGEQASPSTERRNNPRVTQQLEAIGDKSVITQRVDGVVANFKGQVISQADLWRLFEGQRISVSSEITDEELKKMFTVALKKYQVEVVDTVTSQETKNPQALQERTQLFVEVIVKEEITRSHFTHIFNILRLSPDFNDFTDHEIYSTLVMVLGKHGIKVSKDELTSTAGANF